MKQRIKITELQTLTIQSSRILVVEFAEEPTKENSIRIGKMICTPFTRVSVSENLSHGSKHKELLSLQSSTEIH